MNTIISKKQLAALVVLIVIAVLVGILAPKVVPRTDTASNYGGPYQVKVEGKLVCVPHKDTSGPTTGECQYGLQTPDGMYYILATQGLATSIENYTFDTPVTVTGYYTPNEALNTDQWQIYNAEGIIDAETITQ